MIIIFLILKTITMILIIRIRIKVIAIVVNAEIAVVGSSSRKPIDSKHHIEAVSNTSNQEPVIQLTHVFDDVADTRLE